MSFATITAVAGAENVTCRPGESMECAFTVTNELSEPIRVSLRIVGEKTEKAITFDILDAQERDLPTSGSEPVTVRITLPATADPGSYRFRLQAYSTDDPEKLTESPTVSVQVEKAIAPPVIDPPKEKPFPWWIVAVTVAVTVVVGATLYQFSDLLFPTKPEVTEVEVPPLIDDHVEAASKAIKDAGLKVGKIERPWRKGKKTGTVLDQSPPAGTRLPAGSAVDLTVAGILRIEQQPTYESSNTIKATGAPALLAPLVVPRGVPAEREAQPEPTE